MDQLTEFFEGIYTEVEEIAASQANLKTQMRKAKTKTSSLNKEIRTVEKGISDIEDIVILNALHKEIISMISLARILEARIRKNRKGV